MSARRLNGMAASIACMLSLSLLTTFAGEIKKPRSGPKAIAHSNTQTTVGPAILPRSSPVQNTSTSADTIGVTPDIIEFGLAIPACFEPTITGINDQELGTACRTPLRLGTDRLRVRLSGVADCDSGPGSVRMTLQDASHDEFPLGCDLNDGEINPEMFGDRVVEYRPNVPPGRYRLSGKVRCAGAWKQINSVTVDIQRPQVVRYQGQFAAAAGDCKNDAAISATPSAAPTVSGSSVQFNTVCNTPACLPQMTANGPICIPQAGVLAANSFANQLIEAHRIAPARLNDALNLAIDGARAAETALADWLNSEQLATETAVKAWIAAEELVQAEKRAAAAEAVQKRAADEAQEAEKSLVRAENHQALKKAAADADAVANAAEVEARQAADDKRIADRKAAETAESATNAAGPKAAADKNASAAAKDAWNAEDELKNAEKVVNETAVAAARAFMLAEAAGKKLQGDPNSETLKKAKADADATAAAAVDDANRAVDRKIGAETKAVKKAADAATAMSEKLKADKLAAEKRADAWVAAEEQAKAEKRAFDASAAAKAGAEAAKLAHEELERTIADRKEKRDAAVAAHINAQSEFNAATKNMREAAKRAAETTGSAKSAAGEMEKAAKRVAQTSTAARKAAELRIVAESLVANAADPKIANRVSETQSGAGGASAQFDRTQISYVNGRFEKTVQGIFLGELDGTLNGTFDGELDGVCNDEVTGIPGPSDAGPSPGLRGKLTGKYRATAVGKFVGRFDGEFSGTFKGLFQRTEKPNGAATRASGAPAASNPDKPVVEAAPAPPQTDAPAASRSESQSASEESAANDASDPRDLDDDQTQQALKCKCSKEARQFFIASAAHFPLPVFGRDAQRYDQEGAVLYENMEVMLCNDGRYEVYCRVSTPMTTQVRMQLLLQLDDATWVTLTLPTQTINLDANAGRDEQTRKRKIAIKGYAPSLLGRANDVRDVRRRGTARFGSLPPTS
ncbi:MAG: hypothetical protein ACKV0T_22240 [Planctomycetales bacterium]